jgi:hypothetical protein
MAQRPHTPSQGLYDNVPTPSNPTHLDRGYGAAPSNSSHINVDQNDFATTPGNPGVASPLAQSLQPQRSRFEEDFHASQRGSSVLLDGDLPKRTPSTASTLNQGAAPARSGTLKKKGSVRKTGSLKRSGSRRSFHAGSIRGVSIEDDDQPTSKHNSVFYTPVPTSGSPTDVLANRFQGRCSVIFDKDTNLKHRLIKKPRSMAQTSQRHHSLLPRSSDLLRAPIKSPTQGFECDKQYKCTIRLLD